MLNGYLPVLEKLKDAQFVTLTIPNVISEDLKDTIRLMLSQSTNIVRTLKKRFKSFNGIRKIECTYNSITDDYHPHLHFIVEGLDVSNALVNEWLKRFNEANDVAQDVRPVTELKELFKYQTKIISKTKTDYCIFLRPLDTIFCAMKNMRTFQSFGNIKKVTDDLNDLKSEIIEGADSYDLILWHWVKNDWQDIATGKHLTNYKPSRRMNELLTSKMIH
jgi:plasmid rolling circle replication initiator protein Rep